MRRDHEEVCPLSRGVIFQSLSVPLQNGIMLFPRSYARTAIGRLYSPLSPEGAIRGFHVPLTEVRRVRCLLSTGRRMGHESVQAKTLFPPPYRFGPSVLATSACFQSRSLSQIQMFSPYRLSSTFQAYGCQKGTPLAIDTPCLTAHRYIVRVALYSNPWIHPVTRMVSSFEVETTSVRDFVSHCLL